MKKNWIRYAVLAGVVLFIAAILIYLAAHAGQMIDGIVAYLPQGSWRSALVLLALYAVKGLIFVIPIPLLQFAASRLFTKPHAIAINLLGIMLCYLVPYAVGSRFGERATHRFADQYEKIAPFVERCHEYQFEICFIPRLLGFVPNDLLSMYLGAAKVPFSVFLLAGMLASTPKVILNTLAGASIHEPSSPMFLISLSLSILLAAGSVILARKLGPHLHAKKG